MFKMFEDRFFSLINYVKSQIIRIYPDADISCLDEEVRLEKGLDLWNVSAALLSQLRHRPEAASLTAGILAIYESSEEEYDQITFDLALTIIGPISKDDRLFHKASFKIISKTFPEISHFVSCFPHYSHERITISGVELAACLRAVDFILKYFKVS
jgi:hypothetical protein